MRFFHLSRLAANDCGATSIEYALIASLISVGILTAVTTVGNKLVNIFNSVATGF